MVTAQYSDIGVRLGFKDRVRVGKGLVLGLVGLELVRLVGLGIGFCGTVAGCAIAAPRYNGHESVEAYTMCRFHLRLCLCVYMCMHV